jgi:fructose-bisphosphate aldolase class II
MALSKVADIYRNARQGGYGVSGFCAENLDMILAILEAAEETRSPVIVVLWEADIKSVGAGYLEAIVKYGALKTRAPVGIMLDHGQDLAICLECMINGHSGVMIDASHLDLEQNIRTTRQVCDIAHLAGALVEGEIGTVRRSFEASGPYSQETIFTDPADVPLFVRETGVDAVAVSVGTESGIPASSPVLDYERLNKISQSTDAYLVIHGGSGITGEGLQKAIQCGATAFRFASEMRVAYLDALVAARNALPRDYPDTRMIFKPAREAAKKLIVERMEQLGCAGEAW